MEANQAAPTTIDEYIAQFPVETQEVMRQVRAAIHDAAPGATEKISYAMPGFFLHGRLVWFGGYKRHIGFYPGGSAIEVFKEDISVYKWSKGAVQFPLDKPMPLELIKKIVRFRVDENLKALK